MVERKFTLRIEEMPVIGKFLLDSYTRDEADFQGYSPDFDNAYRTDFENKVQAVEDIVNPIKLVGELKKITKRLYANIDSLRPIMNNLEGYVKRVGEDLTIPPEGFGIKAVRAKISNKDQEALLENLKIVIQNIDDNLGDLQAKGWDNAQDTELRTKRQEIKDDNEAQNLKMDERQAKVQDNIGVLNGLWAVMQDVMDTGRNRLYKLKNAEKAGDYTLARLKARIRQERSIDEELPAVE
ncbi:MAG: hypothetical protein ACE5DN_02500 [Flavobacteriales bacterium]